MTAAPPPPPPGDVPPARPQTGPPAYPPPAYPPPSYPPPSFAPGPYPPYPPYPPPPPQKSSRTRLVLALGAAFVVVTAAVVVPLVLLDGDDEDRGGGGTATATDSAAPPDLSEVQRFGTLDRAHVPLGEAVTYEQVPPAGGQHWSAWLDCGAYDSPVQDEYAVHDLEHGAVWITYDPALGDDDVAALEDALPQNGIMSPYDGLPAPVVVTVWGTQLALTGADDPRLPLFIEQYDDGVTAPEPYASCAGGTADGTSA